MNSLTLLLMTHILRYMPTPQYHAYVCSAGSLGYHALKEMLLSGVPGNTLLIESGDLRELMNPTTLSEAGATDGSGPPQKFRTNKALRSAAMNGPPCCLLYTFNICDDDDFSIGEGHTTPPDYNNQILANSHVAVFTDIASLPTNFLFRCAKIKSVDMTRMPLQQITSIGDSYLEGCKGLTSVDLDVFSTITAIPEAFLSRCSGLTKIDMRPLAQVKIVQSCFLQGCSGLKTIDISPLSQVTQITSFFLQKCTSLKSIDLSPLFNVTEIGRSFLSGCTSLKSIDSSPLSQVTKVGPSFLLGCSSLTSINLDGLSRLTETSCSFLEQCTSLTTLDLSPLSNVTRIHGAFVSHCTGLTSINLKLPKLESIMVLFLQKCTSLTSIDMSALSKVKEIEIHFLTGCTSLTTIDLSPLRQLKAVPEGLIEQCGDDAIPLIPPSHLSVESRTP